MTTIGRLLGLGVGHDGQMIQVSFFRNRRGRDRVYVTRSDGTAAGWDFPTYCDGLPHDLCHLAGPQFGFSVVAEAAATQTTHSPVNGQVATIVAARAIRWSFDHGGPNLDRGP